MQIPCGSFSISQRRFCRATLADAFAVATPLLAPDGSLIAAISAAVDASAAEGLDDIGEKLKKAVASLGPQYGLKLS